MDRKTLYLIDGHSQIYRAYYAPFRALTSPKGEPTRAVHVFTQMLLGLLRDRKPDYLIMTMDVADETVFRVDIDKEYKANRQPSPEDLPPQIDRIVTVMEAMKVPILRKQGFEADDLIATVCRRFADADLDIYIVSKDKDLDQLVGKRVRLYDPAKDRVLDAAAILEEKGYGPDKAVEAQMLIGDSTDNIKGVTGVGPKKAAQLLQQYGSVAAIIDHADELSPKLRENMLEFRARMEVVRQLVTLKNDVEIDFDLAAAAVCEFTPSAAVPILRELGLNTLLERILAGVCDEKQQAEATTQVPAIPATLFEAQQQEAPVRPSAQADYRLVDTAEALADLARRMSKLKAFAFDSESTGLTPADSQLVGISLSWEPATGWYIPVRGIGGVVSEEAVRRHLGPVFANPNIKKSGQNLKFDVGMLATIGIEVAGIDFDTMLASFVLDSSRRSHGIDALALDLLNYRKITTEEMIGRGRQQVTFDQLSTQRVCEYACEDADIAWRLHESFERQLTDPELRSLFRDLEMPLIEVLARMEQRGVAVDTEILARLSNQMADRMTSLRDEIHAAAGHPFNLDSTKQLADVLFDERKLPIIRRTKTGRSTDAEVLEALATQTNDPIPKLLLEYREIAKLKGTYVDALPDMISRRTGRIHPSFNQIGAVTGRLSCSDPNLQNIPIRTPLGAQIRRAFVPGNPDSVLLKADYSQIELRVLAHLSGDKILASAFREDQDIHAFVAAQLEGIPIDQVTSAQRASAKTVNFGIVYGQSAFGLARQTGMSQAHAKAFIERYFQRYPRIRDFLDECIAHAKRHGYVKTILGRRRAIPDIDSRNPGVRNAAERFAVNTVVQGSAADLIKRAMINIDRRIQAEKRPLKMLIQVHDELVFETPRVEVEKQAEMVSREMSQAIEMSVPIGVDVAWGPNWLDVK
ncbi:MAG TPA: DNA polymerase I [Phycisphaerae bacterium]|nr:DNA polymerase I [Phycisphaerae bacterium]